MLHIFSSNFFVLFYMMFLKFFKLYMFLLYICISGIVATPLWGKCEVATHTPENGSLESFKNPENSDDDFRGQNTLHWGFFYTVGKVLKCRCPKWPRMSHLDICSPSYGRKKGRESNWQFDSRPLKDENRPDPDVREGVRYDVGKLLTRATTLV